MTLPPGLWWRVPGAAVAVMLLLLWQGEALVQALLPATRWAIAALLPEMEVRSLQLQHAARDHVVSLQAAVNRTLLVGGRAYVPELHSAASASTLALQCLQGPAITWSMALAWPRLNLRRAALAMICMPLLMLADLPAELAGSLWHDVVSQLAPGERSPLLAWHAFISQGGRLVLGIAAGALCVLLSRADAPAGGAPQRHVTVGTDSLKGHQRRRASARGR